MDPHGPVVTDAEMPLMESTKLREPGEGMRKPYEPPAVTWEEDFLPYVYSTCMKMPGQAGCQGVRRS